MLTMIHLEVISLIILILIIIILLSGQSTLIHRVKVNPCEMSV